MRAIQDVLKDRQWAGRRCFCIGSGHSIKCFPFELLNDSLTIGCNEEWRHNPTISIIQDTRELERMRDDADYLAADTIRVYTQGHPDRGAIEGPDSIHLIPAQDRACYKSWGTSLNTGLAYRANVGIAALNLADILGASPIFLLGYDCCDGPEGQTHHHKHYGETWIQTKANARAHKYAKWVKDFEDLAPAIKGNVVNLNLNSAINCFRKARPMFFGGQIVGAVEK